MSALNVSISVRVQNGPWSVKVDQGGGKTHCTLMFNDSVVCTGTPDEIMADIGSVKKLIRHGQSFVAETAERGKDGMLLGELDNGR